MYERQDHPVLYRSRSQLFSSLLFLDRNGHEKSIRKTRNVDWYEWWSLVLSCSEKRHVRPMFILSKEFLSAP